MNVAVRNRQRLLKVDSRLVKAIVLRALELAGLSDLTLTVVLVSDAVMAKYNRIYHHTAGPTDVLSFDYGGRPRECDLLISVERAISQARRFHTTAERELVLYMVHGILHLGGHNDSDTRQRQKMRAAERSVVDELVAEFAVRRLLCRARHRRASKRRHTPAAR